MESSSYFYNVPSRGGLETSVSKLKNFAMNFGPQHPAAHGVLRLILELDGEVVQRADPHIKRIFRRYLTLIDWIMFL
jgi:NADH-quinone oxidoreductase subunit D